MKSILSIDGGGMKGYVPCAVLVELERKAGKPCSEMFDLVAGTSIGGILACIVASGGSATQALKFFTEDGPVIFGHSQILGGGGLIKPRYSSETIESCLLNRIGVLRLSDCKRSLLVPAFDLVAYEPFFFKSTAAVNNYDLWQVARATSAAQTYFPAFTLGDKVLWDGGNVANNPAACAVAEAARMWGTNEKFRVLSLGCGAASSKLTADKLINAGIAAVGVETIGLLFDANDELPDYILRQFLSSGYYRLQPKFTHSLAIDGADPTAIANLQAEADQAIKDFSPMLDDFLAFT